jgi:hypothetical protein
MLSVANRTVRSKHPQWVKPAALRYATAVIQAKAYAFDSHTARVRPTVMVRGARGVHVPMPTVLRMTVPCIKRASAFLRRARFDVIKHDDFKREPAPLRKHNAQTPEPPHAPHLLLISSQVTW